MIWSTDLLHMPVVTLALSLPPTALVKEGGQSSPAMPLWPNRGPWGVLQWGRGSYGGERRGFGAWGQASLHYGQSWVTGSRDSPPPLYMLENVHEEKLRLKVAL